MPVNIEKMFKPPKLDPDPNFPSATKEWKYVKQLFLKNSATALKKKKKLRTLVGYVSFRAYEYIEDYIKTPNEILARHQLSTCRWTLDESLDEFLWELYKLSKNCVFKGVTAEQYREELVRDAFINGLISVTESTWKLNAWLTIHLQTSFVPWPGP